MILRLIRAAICTVAFVSLIACGGSSTSKPTQPDTPDTDLPDTGTPEPENSEPVVQSTPATAIAAGNVYSYQIMVSDADETDVISYAAVTLPSWLAFDPDTGILIGTPQQAHAGNAEVVLSYSDGSVTLQQQFTIAVSASYTEEPPTPMSRPTVNVADTSTYTITAYGAGSIADAINPASYGCVYDYGNWIYNAGVVEPGVSGCDPIGAPTYRTPQVVGEAASVPTPTHKWWGSVSFLGEMKIGDPAGAGYITPDPITARISNKGVRIMGIPNGLGAQGNQFIYSVPDPFSEVFDGIAVANSDYANLEAYLKSYSDGTATVQWQSGNLPVMLATFVHGSPYVFFKAYRGNMVLRTKAADGGEKGTFYNENNSLGIWTSVAGNKNDFLITGEGETVFNNIETDTITLTNAANEFTLTLLPTTGAGTPSSTVIQAFEDSARAVVAKVDIQYSVDRTNNMVTVTHTYKNESNTPVQTLAGLLPMHWKYSDTVLSGYKTRSARGMVQFAHVDSFSYTIPYVGVLPYLPSSVGDFDSSVLAGLVQAFVAEGPENWNPHTDTYWSGKAFNKVAELSAIARSVGMTSEADTLLNWLKAELQDWFSANTNGSLDEKKYFVYDAEWNTLLGLEESFAAHQQLNDHHFHYGYFVRAAAEICRVDASWCSADQYGPMVELLIRDYAGAKDDTMFPYVRNFDPANGFSWASGSANFVLGNNNESTSEAANAYGAIILYGLITGDNELVERGMYLHASSSVAYWEYWNNIDRYLGADADHDNFPSGYDKLTTSIIWGHGGVFSTWFSGAYAHILGIQGLPTNPLIFHVGLHPEYMEDYVALGLSESSNNKPSGLIDDQWRDIWWNLWAMTDAEAAIADYNTVGSNYAPEFGETKAHTYHWLHTWNALGHLKTGTGELTVNDPAALVFEKDGIKTYVAYNFSGTPKTILASDGFEFIAQPNDFTVVTTADNNPDDTQPPTLPANLQALNLTQTSLDIKWDASTDNYRMAGYVVQVLQADTVIEETSSIASNASFNNLTASTSYTVQVKAKDRSGNETAWVSITVTTPSETDDLLPTLDGGVYSANVGPNSADLSWAAATDDRGIASYTIEVQVGGAVFVTETVFDTSYTLSGLTEATEYNVAVYATDTGGQQSATISGIVNTTSNPFGSGCELVCASATSSSSVTFTVHQAGAVDIHYLVNGGNQQNVRMSTEADTSVYEVTGLSAGDVVRVSFTIIPLDGGAYDTDWENYTF